MAFKERFVKILREGPAVGLRMIISGDRGLVADKIGSFIAAKYALPLASREDYSFVGAIARQLPNSSPPGRVFFDGPHLREAQLAVLPGGASGEQQAMEFSRRLQHVARSSPAAARAGARRPLRVDVLPAFVTLDDARTFRAELDEPDNPVTVAVGGDDLSRIAVDGRSLPAFLVTGERRTGRSTTLATITRQLAVLTDTIIVVSLTESPLRSVARELGLITFTEPDVEPARFLEVVRPIRSRAAAAGRRYISIVIDDAEQVRNTVLSSAILQNEDLFAFWVATHPEELIGPHNPIATAGRQGRTGLVLSARSAAVGGNAFNTSLPVSMLGRSIPGRAAFFAEGEYREVQIPTSALQINT
ncbi:hypothetical protein ACL9RL_16785 [Plantibacter sp. Mn2098]|uniref:hypothetical protein n=1 Tax=Plantibacter sp. Mn2098 TaxID=3395266 RepID=UPI003BBE82E4